MRRWINSNRVARRVTGAAQHSHGSSSREMMWRRGAMAIQTGGDGDCCNIRFKGKRGGSSDSRQRGGSRSKGEAHVRDPAAT